MRNRSRWGMAAVGAGVLAATIGLAPTSAFAARPARARTLSATILMPGTAGAAVGGFYTAIQEAKRFHLKLTLKSAGPGVFDTIPQVASGEAAFSLTDSGFVLTARSQGINVVQVFAPYNSPVCVMFHPSENIHSFADLNGHTIAVTPGAPWWLWVQAHYHLTNVNVVNYSYTIAPFISNPNMVQQCFITNEPYVATHQGVPNRTLLVSKAGFNLYDDVLFTTRDEIRKHPDVVAAVVKAVTAGWTAYWKHPAPTNRLLPSYGDTESPAQMVYVDRVLKAIRTIPVGYSAPARMHQAADQMLQIKAISPAVARDWKASFTNAFLPRS
jgi:NitT/TauT family transport system substrate-binding protein